MSFIGIVASKKFFENVKNKILEEFEEKNFSFILINLRSIENVKNIKFEIIIIEDNLEKFKNYKEALKKICRTAKYLVINTDINPNKKIKENQITYGLNQKAIVTISSISDTDILIYCQKSFKNKENKQILIEERRIKKQEKVKLRTYEILTIYIIFQIYNKKIIEQI